MKILSMGRVGLLLLIATVAMIYCPIEKRVAAARLLSSMQGEDRKTQPTPGLSVVDLRLTSGEAIAARIYGPPAEEARLSIVLGHGIHHLGINEPRLIRFALHLAKLGCRVLTPELSDLAEYKVTEHGVEVLQQSVDYLAGQSDNKVGLIGFSFSGGLSLVAAESAETSEKLRYVASIGGHQDLARTLRFLATDQVEGPEGKSARRAHEYGLLVLLRNHLSAFELGEDRKALEQALVAWLKEDRKNARQFKTELKTAKALHIFELLETQHLAQLAPQLLPVIALHQPELSRLSPSGRLNTIGTTVILIHGAGDNVVPPEEALFGAIELKSRPNGHFQSLVTPLLEHVRVDHPAGYWQRWQLVNVVSELL